eukprot:1145346-Pelagomonas_calceolata.AAC.4
MEPATKRGLGAAREGLHCHPGKRLSPPQDKSSNGGPLLSPWPEAQSKGTALFQALHANKKNRLS